jgi:chemosensory pili system protein ChpA (sensor histidine kinase/response regulator)
VSRPQVLLADDDEGIRDFVRLALRDAGCDVTAVEDGLAALELLSSWRPSVILLDMRMPRMDGWQFAEAYKALPAPRAPVVVITAARDAAAYAAQIGADAHLAKPFHVRELVELVRRFSS